MKRIIAGLLIALLTLAAQAADTKHVDRWEKEIAAFEAADRVHPPQTNAILFIGSSGIRMWTTLARDFPEHHVINRGFGGSMIVDSTCFAERIVFPYKPKMIVLRAGTNDLAAGKTADQVIADFKAFVAKVREQLPDTDILYVGMNPTPARWKQHAREVAVNTAIAAFAKTTPHVLYLDTNDQFLDANGQPRADLIAPDKLHFNAAGYKTITALIRPYLPKE